MIGAVFAHYNFVDLQRIVTEKIDQSEEEGKAKDEVMVYQAKLYGYLANWGFLLSILYIYISFYFYQKATHYRDIADDIEGEFDDA